jgi:hypothetical protein
MRLVAADGAGDACDDGGGEYPSGGDQGVSQPLGCTSGRVGITQAERADGDEQVQGVGEGIERRHRPAGQGMGVVSGIDGGASREEQGKPERR